MFGRIAPSILVVDGQPEATDALSKAFHDGAFAVFTAHSAVEGFRILSNTSIDAVVSNEQMPTMSGTEFLSVVRQQYPDVIRVILSGRSDMSSVLAGINDAQAHRLLLKPSSPSEIATCVAQAMDERQKRLGGDAVSHGTEVLRRRLSDHFEVALDSLWVALQPVIRAADSKVFAYEALVRSDHSEFHSPGGLFDVAEQCRGVEQLERTIRQSIAQRLGNLPIDIHLMVNVHPKSLGDPELYSSDSVLYPYRRQIILEITERDSVHDVSGARERIATLRGLGYRVAVDDLGAGYSGPNAFALLHPDFVKFDADLIRDIHTCPEKANLVRTITALCRDIGILTVAEGIETREECEAVINLGCDLLQGYHISVPMRWPKIG